MTILACDTSTATLHLALVKDDAVIEERMILSFQHSEGLLEQIDDILSSNGLSLADIDLFACTRGPGSFTSLRIAMSTMKAFSLALDRPLVSVATLQAIAQACTPAEGLPVIPVIDAKKRRYYIGLYRNGEAIVSDIDGDVADIIGSIRKEKRIVVTGPDAAAFASRLSQALPSVEVSVDDDVPRPLGAVIARMAAIQLEKSGQDDIGQGPVYIRRSDAEEALLEKRRKEEGR